MRSSFASLALFIAACGGSPLDPGAGNDPGTGTNTLLVDGNVTAHATLTNAVSSNDFETEFTVRVSLNNVPVTTGTVTIKSQLVEVPLTWRDNGGQGGQWEGTAAGYDEVYQLDVVSGADKVEGVIVDGPDIHVFTAPMAGASLDSTMSNTMTWDRNDPADIATFRVGDLDRITIADTGSYDIPPGSLKAEKDTARPNTLSLTRTNHVAPKGAVSGSDLAVGVENHLDVVALPNPAL